MGRKFAPQTSKFAIGVIIQRLLLDVKSAESTWVRSDTCGIRPIAPVGGGAVIHTVGFKPPGPQTPIDVKVLGEEGGHVLAAPVAHESRLFEFDHVCINKGFPGLSSRKLQSVPRNWPSQDLGLGVRLFGTDVARASTGTGENTPAKSIQSHGSQ